MATENNVIITTIVDNLALPFAVAAIVYWLSSKRDEYNKRKNHSRLGVAIIESLMEEVENGYRILLQAKSNGTVQKLLPRRSWYGMETINDDVLLRIIAVSKDIKPRCFPPRAIRIHCKNYFEHMTANFDQAVSQNSVGFFS